MDAGGERTNEVWTDFCTGRQNRLRNRGIRNVATACAISDEERFRLHVTLSRSGFSVFQMVIRSYTVDIYAWRGSEVDAGFAQDTYVSSHFTLQRRVQAMAHQAMLKDMAKSKMEHNHTSRNTRHKVGDSAIFYKQSRRKKGSDMPHL